jgi:hypothetical protein
MIDIHISYNFILIDQETIKEEKEKRKPPFLLLQL